MTKTSLEQIRLKLLDLSMRNKLLNYSKSDKRKRLIIVDELPNQIFDMLVNNEKNMIFDPVPLPKKSESDKYPFAKDYALYLSINTDTEAPAAEENTKEKHTDNYIQTLHFPQDMETILKKHHTNARQAIEETGANMLYLIIGFLEWSEYAHQEVKRYAPLIMVPVRLERGRLDKKSLTYRYSISYTGEDIVPNLALREKLSRDFGLFLPEFDEDMNPEEYFNTLKPILENMPNFKVLREFGLDFLAFSKILMYLDLDEDRWTKEKSITKHPLIQKILNGSLSDSFGFAKEYDIDNYEKENNLELITDADSSQHSAIIDVIQGKNLVIEGPPGTGKSQTITNIIASALSKGKRVLFVAEKLAALEVVKDRLEKSGIGELCLEIHSHKSHKHKVIKDIEKRLNTNYEPQDQVVRKVQELESLKNILNTYAELISTVHTPSNLTFHDILWRAEKYRIDDFTPPYMEQSNSMSYEEILNIETTLETLLRFIDEMPDIVDSVWYGYEPTNALSMDAPRIEQLWLEYSSKTDILIKDIKDYASDEEIEINSFVYIDDLKEVFSKELFEDTPKDEEISLVNSCDLKMLEQFFIKLNRLKEKYDELGDIKYEFIYSIEDLQYIEKTAALYNHSNGLSKFISSDFRKAKRLFKTIFPKEKMVTNLVINQIKELQLFLKSTSKLFDEIKDENFSSLLIYKNIEFEENFEIKEIKSFMDKIDIFLSYQKAFSWLLKLNDTDKLPHKLKNNITKKSASKTIEKAKTFLNQTYQDKKVTDNIFDMIEEYGKVETSIFYGQKDITFEVIQNKHTSLKSQFYQLNDWIEYSKTLHMIYEHGLAWIIGAIRDKKIKPKNIVNVFRYGYYLSLSKQILREHRQLGGFSRQHHEQIIERFKTIDKEILELNHKLVTSNASKVTPPAGVSSGKVAELTEMGLLKNELRKKKRHISLRSLLKRAPQSILALKPCFMMSPMSCAQYLEPGKIEFDLMVIDEASQVKPEDALGAIARAKQVVVVGDPKQLPPTSFFDKKNDIDEDEASIIEDAESILDVCMQTFSTSRRLKWHYRSSHESLIAFSNKYFYDGDLFLFPSPREEGKEFGIKYHYIETGRFINQHNTEEANFVAKAIIEHFRINNLESIGVVAMNAKQAEYIDNLIEKARKADISLDKKIIEHEKSRASFFIKNLENVQGDERDVIFISTTYGADENGKQYQRFGPINSEYGHRRLNVLITRAKKRIEIFTSMLSSDIVVTQSSSRGHIALKNYLKYAESGVLQSDSNKILTDTKKEKDLDFGTSVSKLLHEAGYETDIQVGEAGHYIDIAVKHLNNPNKYILAIECDGDSYTSSKNARDRDRLKETVLKRMGWVVHKIWSADWFNHREREIKRLFETIDSNKLNNIKEEE